MLNDHYITRAWHWATMCLAIDMAIMSIFRVIRSTMWPPFMVCVDFDPDLLKAYTRFHTPVCIIHNLLITVFTQ